MNGWLSAALPLHSSPQQSGVFYELPVQTAHTSIIPTQSTALTPSQLHRFSQPSGHPTGLSRSITRLCWCTTPQKPCRDVGGWWMLFPEGGKSLPFLSGYPLMKKRGRQPPRCAEVSAALLRHKLHLLMSPYVTSSPGWHHHLLTHRCLHFSQESVGINKLANCCSARHLKAR